MERQSWFFTTSFGPQTVRMKRVVVVFLLPLLGLLHAGPLFDEPVLQPQENFDVNRFMGKWYDIATASTHPWMKRHKADAAIGSMELQSSDSTQTISMTRMPADMAAVSPSVENIS